MVIIRLIHNTLISLLSIGPVAQGIEQWFPKPCAACSNHAGATSTVNKIQLGVLRVSEIV